ncbi:hypothetical protein NDR87_03050 [Nocardia sp. CDC159]|uniref:Lipoprotein n=1 Tax=Nocardia pulmonis TaxID=2951408 RepID=A0A9X2E1A1_9NOCA|nr:MULTISPECIES: hypothetical protein [Nocardia]MCM6772009.1 hypothetical protein [Nocardia pulmonis]MCM6785333.1 hypothetical protein [Nocardia sp. CDC159]
MNTQPIWKAAAAVLMSAAACTVLTACGPTPNTFDPGVQTRVVEPSWAFDPGDQRQLAGWADAVFVGTVMEKSGTDSRMPALPETQFRVKVVETLKGNPTESVTVNQQGGYVAGKGELVLVYNDQMISVGKSYLFATRYLAEKNWYTVAPRIGDVELTPAELQAVESSLRTRSSEPEIVRRMRDSITNQVPLGDKREPETPVTPSTPPPSAPITPPSPDTAPRTPSMSPSTTAGR